MPLGAGVRRYDGVSHVLTRALEHWGSAAPAPACLADDRCSIPWHFACEGELTVGSGSEFGGISPSLLPWFHSPQTQRNNGGGSPAAAASARASRHRRRREAYGSANHVRYAELKRT